MQALHWPLLPAPVSSSILKQSNDLLCRSSSSSEGPWRAAMQAPVDRLSCLAAAPGQGTHCYANCSLVPVTKFESFLTGVSRMPEGSDGVCHRALGVGCNWRTTKGMSSRGVARMSAATVMESDSSVVLEASTAEEIMKRDGEVIVQTYARAPIVIVRGQGCKLYDAEGREYLDMAAGIAVNSLGHSDPAWVKAVSDQAAILTHVSNLYFTEPQVKLASRLVASSFADRVFFVNSGTEANEAAIKLARKFQRVRHAESGAQGPPPTEFVSFSNCFHGRTLGALALTWKEQYRTPFEPLMPGAAFATYGDLDSAAQAIKKGRTAAVFVEPLQGEGGVHSASKEFLQGVKRLCDESGALLVFDEVQCGLGRTGKLWAHEEYDINPDIMTLAKPLAGGLPIGVVLATEAVASAMSYGDHGSTFAGGPLICTAALAVLDRFQSDGFLEGVAKKGVYLKKALENALGSSKHVTEVRGVGLLVGVQLNVAAGPVVDAAREAGVLAITAGKGDVLRLAPPLIISHEEIDFAVSVLAGCINKLP